MIIYTYSYTRFTFVFKNPYQRVIRFYAFVHFVNIDGGCTRNSVICKMWSIKIDFLLYRA